MTGLIQSAVLPEWWDPARVFLALYRDSRYAFWLDAGAGAETGVSYLGAAAGSSRFVTASVPEGTVTVTRAGAVDAAADAAAPAITSPETIFDFLRKELAGTPATDPDDGPEGDPGATDPDGHRDGPDIHAHDGDRADGFRLGWVGWLGYELGAQTVGTPVHDSRFPDAALLEVDRALVFDHAARTVTALVRRSPGDPGSARDWARSVTLTLRASAAPVPVPESAPEPEPAPAPAPEPAPAPAPAPETEPEPAPATAAPARWRHDPGQYAELIRRCQASIREGDAYQLCLTNEIRVDVRLDPVLAYLTLRAGSPSHHGGLLRFGDTALLSASPEQFLAVTRDGLVTTKPIKGTSPRGGSAEHDRELRAGLESSEKERAENLMIVDLMRNDLGRIAELGSVTVTSLLAVESYAHVHQLVSTIEARLAAGLSAVDAVASCFPAGSMTGAPKVSAMTILDGLEGGPRGIYAGAFGYFGLDGAVDLAMVIRSIVLDAGGASIGTGGGITALSDPAAEIEETRIKAAALLAAVGAAVPAVVDNAATATAPAVTAAATAAASAAASTPAPAAASTPATSSRGIE